MQSERARTVAHVAITAAISAALVVVVPASAWAATGWGIIDSPNLNGSNSQLSAVSCISASSCMAVGSHGVESFGSSVAQPLVETWNGTSWMTITSPNQRTSDNELNGVACTSATSCMAVGFSINPSSERSQTLAERWNGSTWAIIPSPNKGTADNILSAVSCASSTSCVAVGHYFAGLASSKAQALAERWNGSRWAITASPDQGTSDNVLNALSCTSSTSCVAVGDYAIRSRAAAVFQTLVESWNGTAWMIVASPNEGTGSNSVNGVACTGAKKCVAVGDYVNASISADQTLVETWNGSTWSITPSPNRSDNELTGVACTSSTKCMAVGAGHNGSSVTQTLVEAWDGAAWSIVASPNRRTSDNQLTGVACASSTGCIAVGYDFNAPSVSNQTLVEGWNGTSWSIIASPNHSTRTLNELNGVACTSSTSCMAVGDSRGSRSRALAQNWNGSTWAINAIPAPSGLSDAFTGVACTGSASCVAVGRYLPVSEYQTLVEAWNGTSWSIVASPNLNTDGTAPNELNSVSCSSSTSCMAVGDYGLASVHQTLAESWNGSTWTIVASPDQGTSDNVLSSVSCTGPISCAAVGHYIDESGTNRTLIEAWDGSAWTIVASPNQSTSFDELNGVACTSSTTCTAVGDDLDETSGTNQTLIESWSGGAWSVTSSANRGTRNNNALFSVSCTSPSSCVAVGSANLKTLVETWNGTLWSIIPSLSRGTGDNLLRAASCTSSTSCTAVGAYESPGFVPQTLIEAGPASAPELRRTGRR